MNKNIIALGYIARPHGVHGAMIVTPFSENSELLPAGRNLWLLPADGATDPPQPLPPIKVKSAAQGFIIKIPAITTREAAQGLKGWRVAIERENMPEPDEDEFYWTDLLHLSVITDDGQILGPVVNFMDAGGGLILVVSSAQLPGKELLIPFNETIINDVDLVGKQITITPLPGLLD